MELLLFLFLALLLPPKNNFFLLAVAFLSDNPLPPLTTTDAMASDAACMCVSFSFLPGFSTRRLLRGGKEGGEMHRAGSESVLFYIARYFFPTAGKRGRVSSKAGNLASRQSDYRKILLSFGFLSFAFGGGALFCFSLLYLSKNPYRNHQTPRL